MPKYLLVPMEIALEYPAKTINEIKTIRFLWFPVTIPSSIIIFIKYGWTTTRKHHKTADDIAIIKFLLFSMISAL